MGVGERGEGVAVRVGSLTRGVGVRVTSTRRGVGVRVTSLMCGVGVRVGSHSRFTQSWRALAASSSQSSGPRPAAMQAS